MRAACNARIMLPVTVRETVQRDEVLDVDGEEEMADHKRAARAIRREAQQVLQERAADSDAERISTIVARP